jgi:hypothetical protein
MYILVYIKKMYVPETKSERDKHNFKYFKGGAIWTLSTGAILYRYASALLPPVAPFCDYLLANIKTDDQALVFHVVGF